MSNNSANLDRLLRETGAQGDASEKIREAAQNNPDIAGISAILNYKQALAHIMSSPKAQALLKRFKG